MLKKVIGFNGSPRKNWNTYQMVSKALEGAKSAGAQTKLINLSDLKFGPCQSCLSCQKSEKNAGKCSVKDGLSPILDEIKTADALIFGTPIYFTYISGLMHNCLERMWFSNLSYSPKRTNFPRTTKSAMIYTMNVDEQTAKNMGYEFIYNLNKRVNEMIFKGECKNLCAYFTQQVKDYSKYQIKSFDPEQKYKYHKEHFPKDLQNAFELGRSLVLD